MMNKQCVICKTNITKPIHYSYKQWEQTKCCGSVCRSVLVKGRSVSSKTQFKVGHIGYKYWLGRSDHPESFWKGKKLSEAHKQKMRENRVTVRPWLGKTFSDDHRKKLSWARIGKKPWNWLGGVESLLSRIRSLTKYKEWRSAVFRRDLYTCIDCYSHGVELNADHIKPLSVIVSENKIKTIEDAILCEEIWDVDNGRTLCVGCHRETDTYAGRVYKFIKISCA